jgi:hypothetical protein
MCRQGGRWRISLLACKMWLACVGLQAAASSDGSYSSSRCIPSYMVLCSCVIRLHPGGSYDAGLCHCVMLTKPRIITAALAGVPILVAH